MMDDIAEEKPPIPFIWDAMIAEAVDRADDEEPPVRPNIL